MGAGKDIYEENKRLRLENDNLREERQIAEEKNRIVAEELLTLAMASLRGLLQGQSKIIVARQPDGFSIRFQPQSGD